jgi:hypothetical protein
VSFSLGHDFTAGGINGIKSFDHYAIIMYPFYIQQANSKIKATF